jgi:hypothetical protein
MDIRAAQSTLVRRTPAQLDVSRAGHVGVLGRQPAYARDDVLPPWIRGSS